MIALIEAHRDGLLARAHWLPNLAAGLVVGAGAQVSLFGGSRLQVAGPTGAFIALLSAITA